jgi:cyclopropane fatty-acyl-phospholipid synthase-like methyltransferase
MTKGYKMAQRLLYNLWYYFNPPWDTGITPPEVVEAIGGPAALKPGRALDLGCGTGTNSLYLARHGWEVVGVDLAARAVRKARRKAQESGLSVDFYTADVTRLDFLQPPFDLALDIGCFHALNDEGRVRYRDQLRRLLCPGARLMLYAFGPRQGRFIQMGVTPDQVRRLFESDFRLLRVEGGADPTGPSAAWYWLERTCGITNSL